MCRRRSVLCNGPALLRAFAIAATALCVRSAAAQAIAAPSFSTQLNDQQAAAIESHTAKDLHRRECGIHSPNQTLLIAAQAATNKKATQLAQETHTESSALININVYVHVVSQGPALTDGNVPDSWVLAQMTTMNKAYVATGFQVRSSDFCTQQKRYCADCTYAALLFVRC